MDEPTLPKGIEDDFKDIDLFQEIKSGLEQAIAYERGELRDEVIVTNLEK